MGLVQGLTTSITGFIENLTGDQLMALFGAVVILFGAGKTIKRGLSLLLSLLAMILLIYFLAPELYAQLFGLVQRGLDILSSGSSLHLGRLRP